jgi:hypothetical protein
MLYVRFPLSLRNVEDLLSERGLIGRAVRHTVSDLEALHRGFTAGRSTMRADNHQTHHPARTRQDRGLYSARLG